MRFIICFFVFFMCCNVSSQQKTVNNSAQGTNFQLQNFTSDAKNSGANDGSYKGTFLLFNDWKNNGSVQITGKKYALNSVNFNVQNNEFMYKNGEKGIFTIAPNHIDFVHIKNKSFKYHLYKDEHKFFEILFESKKRLSLFKGYHIRILPKSELGMLSRPLDEIKKEEKFYVKNGIELVVLKLKKKDILKFIDKDKQNAILKFVKERSLSYKKEKDILEIFKYYDKI